MANKTTIPYRYNKLYSKWMLESMDSRYPSYIGTSQQSSVHALAQSVATGKFNTVGFVSNCSGILYREKSKLIAEYEFCPVGGLVAFGESKTYEVDKLIWIQWKR